jgi:tRNA A37 threonylcarbamoyladenosine dehydratase
MDRETSALARETQPAAINAFYSMGLRTTEIDFRYVAVVGCGGQGGYIAEQLAVGSSGNNLIDGD